MVADTMRNVIDKVRGGCRAAAIHLGWGYWVTKGTMLLDDIYVHMSRANWHVLWTLAGGCEALAPLALGAYAVAR